VAFNAVGMTAPEGVKYTDNLRMDDATPDDFSLGQALHPSVGGEYEATIRSWGVPVYLRGGQMACDWAYAPIQYPHLVRDFYLRNRGFIGGTRVNSYNPRIWITAAPTWYVWNRVQWNPELDVDAALDEMCRRLFGPAAETCRELLRLQCDRWEKTPLSRPLTWEDRHGGQLPGYNRGMGSLLQEWRLPDDLYREIWPADVVARLKELYEKAKKEIAASGDENVRLREDLTTWPSGQSYDATPGQARRAFYHWNWTTEAFFEEAEAVHRKLPAEAARDQKETPFGSTNGLPSSLAFDLGDGVMLKVALIGPGEFLMGSATNAFGHHKNEDPRHRVRITKPFYLDIHELTVLQYEAVMGKGSYKAPGNTGQNNDRQGWDKITSLTNRPVERMSWYDATDFCRKLGEKIGRSVRLPTEAEWEYACRAGTTTEWFSGDVDRLAALNEYAWCERTLGGPQDVGGKKPNAWGLYDMHGNVYEWCNDRFASDYYAWSPTDNPAGPTNGMFRVMRGGANFVLSTSEPELVRSARRNYAHPDVRSRQVGFRVVVEAGGEKTANGNSR
jgi:formylglycine-generating enzyme required for sulfatase activity